MIAQYSDNTHLIIVVYIHSTLCREKDKNLPDFFGSYEEIPEYNVFFKILSQEDFLIFKDKQKSVLVFNHHLKLN